MNITSFSEHEINVFKNMIGKQFVSYKCDPFIYSPMVYGLVGIYVDNVPFKITSLCQSTIRFFSTEDVALLRISQTDDTEIKTFMDNGELVKTPVEGRIVAIDLITDHQEVEHDGKIQSFNYSTGIIFHLDDTREISLEIKTWFSEMLTIEKGYNLIEKFSPIENFLEEWERCEGYTAKCTREIVTIQ